MQLGKNIQAEVKGTTLTLVIDLSQDFGRSSSGKNVIVATTSGNHEVEGADGLVLGLNAYRKA